MRRFGQPMQCGTSRWSLNWPPYYDRVHRVPGPSHLQLLALRPRQRCLARGCRQRDPQPDQCLHPRGGGDAHPADRGAGGPPGPLRRAPLPPAHGGARALRRAGPRGRVPLGLALRRAPRCARPSRRAGRLRPDLPLGHPRAVHSGARPARRRPAPAVAARRARAVLPRHLRRRGQGGGRDRPGGHRRDQRADAPHARQQRRAVRPDPRLHRHRPAPPRAQGRARDLGRGAHRRDRRRAGRGRLDAADWASAASRTPSSRACTTSTTWASTRRCSPTGSSTWWSPAPSPTGCKVVGERRIVTSFINGTRRLFDFVDDNPLVDVLPLRLDERHRHHPAEPEGGRHQLRHRRSTSRARSAPTRSGTASTRASAARWTSSAARRSRPGGKPIIALPVHGRSAGAVSRIVDPAGARGRAS